MDYELSSKFSEWVSKNPVIGTLTIIGMIAAIIVIAFLSRKMDEWELRKRYRK